MLDQAFRQIEAQLNTVMGLDAATVGQTTISLAVKTRMRRKGITGAAAYSALVSRNETELQELIEEVIVPETWFFRDRQPFFALADWAMNEWLPAHPQEVLRVVSMPCSTGEEPYSAVMALLDAGIPPERFVVEGIDISLVSLEKARRGSYSRNSFRSHSLDFRDRHFSRDGERWQISDAVRKNVQFRQANLLDPAFGQNSSAKHAIFCRNVLIYFDADSQRRVLSAIDRMLAPEGILFAGHSEAYLYSDFGFAPAQIPMAFAFRKRSAKPAASGPASKRSSAPVRKPALPHVPASVPAKPREVLQAIAPKPGPPSVKPEATSAEAMLAQAEVLADGGKFDEAMQRCQQVLGQHGPSVKAFYLLALIQDAAGKLPEAAEMYRKALYLEPNHAEALVHLALLSEKTGDLKTARQLQQRMSRVQDKSRRKGT